MAQYPKAKYHASLPVVCVYSPEEEKTLGDGWFDYPHQVHEVKKVPPKPKVDLTPRKPNDSVRPDNERP